jgi:hypothetical protein
MSIQWSKAKNLLKSREKILQIGETKLFMAMEEEASIREDEVAEKGERKVQRGFKRAETGGMKRSRIPVKEEIDHGGDLRLLKPIVTMVTEGKAQIQSSPCGQGALKGWGECGVEIKDHLDFMGPRDEKVEEPKAPKLDGKLLALYTIADIPSTDYDKTNQSNNNSKRVEDGDPVANQRINNTKRFVGDPVALMWHIIYFTFMRMWLAFTGSGLELDEENITGPLEQRSHQTTSVTKYGHGSKTRTGLNAYPATNLGKTNLPIPSTIVSLSPAFSSNKYPSKLLEKFMFLERKVSSTL